MPGPGRFARAARWRPTLLLPLQITFRHIDPSPALEARVRELAERLDRFYDSITSCRVVVSTAPAHRHKGGPFSVRIDLALPGGEVFAHSQLEDYGRIETAEGRMVYFHRNSVHGAQFEALLPGAKVWHEEEPGDLGAQAAAVRLVAAAA